MRGIVKDPVVTVFATELPDTLPMRALATTAAFAGPPLLRPVRAKARSIKNLPAPEMFSTAPKRTNRKMNVADTPSGTPKMPSVLRYIYGASSETGNDGCWSIPGSQGPKIAYRIATIATIGRGQPTVLRVASITRIVIIIPITTSDEMAAPSRIVMASQLRRILRQPKIRRPAKAQSQRSILSLGRFREAG